MSIKTKAVLITLLSIGILVLLAYGYMSSQKLDAKKEKAVQSNIKDYLYDEAADTFDLEDASEDDDIDGDEVVDEDDDFEVYEEPEPEEEIELVNENTKETIEETVAGNPGEVYYVIVGTFKSKSNAERKVNQLKDKSIKGFVTQLKNSKLNTVVAGQFQTKKDADQFLSNIKSAHDIQGVVKKVD